MFTWIKNYLLYAKVDPVEFEKVKEAVSENNKKSLSAYSAMGIFFFALILAFTLISKLDSVTDKVLVYSVAIVLNLVIFHCNKATSKSNQIATLVLMYLFNAELLGFGLFLAFVTTPNRMTVSLLVMQMLTPLIFTDKPYRFFLTTIILDIIFIILAIQIKPKEILAIDIIDVVIYGMIGLVVGSYMSRMKYERFVLERQVGQLNNEQQLTHYITSMSDIYETVVQVDLKSGTFRTIKNQTHLKSFEGNENFFMRLKNAMTEVLDENSIAKVAHFANQETIIQLLKGKRTITHEFLAKNAGWCRGRYIAIGNRDLGNAPEQMLFAVENINEQKNREKQLITQAETDNMTGLYNRTGGVCKITENLHDKKHGLFCLFDIDKFKQVNDNYGHQVGDQVIIAVANAMKKVFRDEDILLRLGGDEYIAFLNKISTEAQATIAIGRLFAELESIVIEAIPNYDISISLGAAFFKSDSSLSFDELYKRADTCTYQSKKIEGKSFTFWRE